MYHGYMIPSPGSKGIVSVINIRNQSLIYYCVIMRYRYTVYIFIHWRCSRYIMHLLLKSSHWMTLPRHNRRMTASIDRHCQPQQIVSGVYRWILTVTWMGACIYRQPLPTAMHCASCPSTAIVSDNGFQAGYFSTFLSRQYVGQATYRCELPSTILGKSCLSKACTDDKDPSVVPYYIDIAISIVCCPGCDFVASCWQLFR